MAVGGCVPTTIGWSRYVVSGFWNTAMVWNKSWGGPLNHTNESTTSMVSVAIMNRKTWKYGWVITLPVSGKPIIIAPVAAALNTLNKL
jgi:hypothetical protein